MRVDDPLALRLQVLSKRLAKATPAVGPAGASTSAPPMGPELTTLSAHARPRRPRWRAYLLLARVSNLPTVWTNVLAGIAVSGAMVDWPVAVALIAANSLVYTAGMFLNDAFDYALDKGSRPERPLPAGDLTVRHAFSVGWLLLATGVIVLVSINRSAAGYWWALCLAAAVTYYDYRHKGNPLGPLVMGLCRGLVYCVAAAATGGVSIAVLTAATLMTGYVAGLTLVSKRLGPRGGWLIPYLLAGISLLDAAIAARVAAPIAPWLAIGFVVTLLGQRTIPGD